MDAALLILDMQNDIIGRHRHGNGHGGAMPVEDLVSRILELRDGFRQAGLPVIYTRVAYRLDYADAHVTAPARARSGNGRVTTAIPSRIKPVPQESEPS